MARRELTEKEIKQLETMAGCRVKEHDMAAILGMSKTKLNELRKNNDAVEQAVLNGRAKAATNITKKAYDLAMAGNVTMLIFWLKTQQGWKEPKEAEETKQPINITYNVDGKAA